MSVTLFRKTLKEKIRCLKDKSDDYDLTGPRTHVPSKQQKYRKLGLSTESLCLKISALVQIDL